MKRNRVRLLIILFVISGSLLCGKGVWIHAKALLAQVLLRQAWEQTLVRGQPVKPWPWADTWPVARLRTEKHGQDMIVLAGQSGAALAFGPGMLAAGGKPGKSGACILAGHRDTHFRFLQHIQIGDVLILEGRNGGEWRYRVSETTVRLAENLYIEQQTASRLALITCYPFNAVNPSTRQRYLVLADRV